MKGASVEVPVVAGASRGVRPEAEVEAGAKVTLEMAVLIRRNVPDLNHQTECQVEVEAGKFYQHD